MKHILIAFDGTGSRQWKRTESEGRGLNSHISRFWQDFNTEGRLKKYYEGPGNEGGSAYITEDALRWFCDRSNILRENQDDVKICIIGHSRGALSAIQFANALNSGHRILNEKIRFSQTWRLPITVDFLGLYDAVDRDISGYDTTENGLRSTQTLYHARRKEIGWSGTRATFSSIDISKANYCQDFDTSHGGIGGDPGLFTPFGLTEDNYCSALTLILNLSEMNQYGGVRVADLSNPRYAPITDSIQRRHRANQIKSYLQNSIDADKYIRTGALAAQMPLSRTSPHIPYDNGQERWWQRLQIVFSNSDISF